LGFRKEGRREEWKKGRMEGREEGREGAKKDVRRGWIAVCTLIRAESDGGGDCTRP